MKVTAIKQQVKRAGRYSIFVEGEYAFSLSETALLDSKLTSGQELTSTQLEDYKKLSSDDKLYNRTLRWVAMRPRSRWEIEFYLQRKDASPPLVDIILNKLSIIGLIDDAKLAKALVSDRRLLRPTSRRKIIAELRKKHLSQAVIEEAVGHEQQSEEEALAAIVIRKRKQTKYQDDTKLMQYLARQGFGYDDIKRALGKDQH